MKLLILSIFPGGGLLDHAFEAEAFTVARGPSPAWACRRSPRARSYGARDDRLETQHKGVGGTRWQHTYAYGVPAFQERRPTLLA